VDGNGTVHVAYNAEFRRRYAKRVNGAWTVTLIGDRTTNCSPYAEALALNASNYPTIAAWDPCSDQILVRSFNGTIWDAFGDVLRGAGGFPPLRYNGSVLCAAYVTAAGNLRYATRSGGVWTIETVAAGNPNFPPSLQIRSDGVPVIAFTAGTGNAMFLRVATKSAGWQFENLDLSGPSHGLAPDLKLGPGGLPRIVFASWMVANQDGTQKFAIRYAMKTTTGWTM